MNTTVSSINDKTIKRHEVMAGLSAGNIAAFVGRVPEGNDLTADIKDKKLSVDQDYFHRTFDIQDGEKGNKDRRDEINEERILAQKEREEDADNLGDAVEAVAEELREKLAEKIKLGNGLEIDPEELRKINKKYRDQVDGKTNAELAQTAEEEGISVEWLLLRADIAEDIDTNGYDRTRLEEKWGKENVDQYEDNVRETKENEASFEQKYQASLEENNTDSSYAAEVDELLSEFSTDTSAVAKVDTTEASADDLLAEFSLESDISTSFNNTVQTASSSLTADTDTFDTKDTYKDNNFTTFTA